MADEATYLIRLAAWLAEAIGGIAPLFADFSTDHLGIDLPGSVLQAPAVTNAASRAQAGAKKVGDAGAHLESAAAAGNDLQILAAFLELGGALADLFSSLSTLTTAVKANITPANIPDAAARTSASNFA